MTESDPAAVAAFIGGQSAEHKIPHRPACRVLGVSKSSYDKWRHEPTTARDVRRGKLVDAIKKIFDDSDTVAQLMAELGPAGRTIRRRRGLTRPGMRPAFPAFVRRVFTASAPDQAWCGDMTEIVTGEGKVYLACVIDLFSRRLLGSAMGARNEADPAVELAA